MNMDLTVDFTQRRLSGSVALDIENLTGSSQLVLDTHDLAISSITYEDGSPAPFTVGAGDLILKQPLTITLRADTRRLVIQYATTKNEFGLYWIAAALTTDRRTPILYTQNQSSFARSWIPSQDTPSARLTYEATIRVPAGMIALMSAENPTTRTTDNVYRFRMRRPIPVYLVALAVGDFSFREFGPSMGIYAEPSVVESAAAALVDTPAMMAAAQRLWGPYLWERYDVLMLPKSYVFLGMENPRLTFVNTTLLDNDYESHALIAHEFAHSWAGNLVTAANWNHTWLNEGVGTYLELRIMEEVYGPELSEEYAAAIMREVRADVEKAATTLLDTRLRLFLDGDYPQYAFSDISYYKGYAFMRMLEEKLGRSAVDRFLRNYFGRYGFEWMDSETFLSVLVRDIPLNAEQVAELHLEEWIFAPGLPQNAPVFPSMLSKRLDSRIVPALDESGPCIPCRRENKLWRAPVRGSVPDTRAPFAN